VSDWAETTLGEVLALDINTVQVDPDASYAIVGVLNRGRGLLYRDSIKGTETSYRDLNRISPGQVVYSRLKAFEGAITVAPADLSEAYASQEFPTFTCGERLLPGYFALLTTTPRLWDILQNLSTGMGGRRERVKPKDFLTIEIPLPPLAHQRRIVDVMAAVDSQVNALAEELGAAEKVIDAAITDAMDGLPDTLQVGAIASARSGPSYKAADVSDHPLLGALAVIGIPNTKPNGTLDLAGIGYVSGLSASVAVIDESSIIMIRTNGNRKRIGNVYLPPPEAHGHAVSAFQFLLKVTCPEDREFVYWALREPGIQARMSEAASGTTGLSNLAAKWLTSAEIPWTADGDARSAIAARLRSQQLAADRLRNELEKIRAFRSTLITALIRHETEIPESYDRLLGAAPLGAA
jgi:type I restriction enzyme S subunit